MMKGKAGHKHHGEAGGPCPVCALRDAMYAAVQAFIADAEHSGMCPGVAFDAVLDLLITRVADMSVSASELAPQPAKTFAKALEEIPAEMRREMLDAARKWAPQLLPPAVH